ncbi:4-hydroxybenzoate polyprenyltransferase, mitochondrial isoform X1 [Iris pallida]|uniref:4-hydroxybenzoate polyprenyltransferase, mitochondrial n=1 Tax=Iris pallida TaxID=29817 RepID=A0AAX6HB36_IRIPA|nr:4-hydroxybenzoate polyprenyltransferase, mitochondrial isoform X1 [Iris pallida]
MALLLSRSARRLNRPLSLFSIIPQTQNPSNPLDPHSHSPPGPKTLEKTPIFPPRAPSPNHRGVFFGRLARSRLQIASVSTSSGTEGEGGERKQSPPPSNDASSGSSYWINAYLPNPVRPYALLARLDKPIGTWLLAWPCMWSITMATTPGELPDLKMLALFGCGAVLLRGAGCTVNDLLDQDIDKKVERTKYRPVACGVLTPFQGFSFLCFQLSFGLGILLQLNNYSRVLGASSLLLVFSYPLMKRLTFWPQAYLGLTFNWGALLGWVAIKESLDPAIVLPLYSAGVFWTLVYDTIYAHQDKEDDLKVGVKSTALRFGSLTKNWIGGFGIACIASLTLSGYNAELAWPYYPFLMVAASQLGWQIISVDLSNRADCNRKFVSNKWFGAFVFTGILFGRLAS